jgi:CheY-like chemotaxis protein
MARILIVDDDEHIVQMLADILADEAHAVAGRTSGLRAVGLAQDFAPEVILLNTCMPYRDGFEVAALLGEDELLRRVPIIMTTACGVLREGITERDLEALGVVACLYKPFELTDLLEKIDHALRA